MTSPTSPVRIFLDTGVLVQGITQPWGAAKAVLILMTLRPNYIVVLAEAVEMEMQDALRRKAAASPSDGASILRDAARWQGQVRTERHTNPTPQEVSSYFPLILPALRHINDLLPVVTAIQARPDWVLSTNTEHWNERLAERTGLRIATPRAFLAHLSSINS